MDKQQITTFTVSLNAWTYWLQKIIGAALAELNLHPSEIHELTLEQHIEPGNYWIDFNNDAFYAWVEVRKGQCFVWVSGNRCDCGEASCSFCSWVAAYSPVEA